MGRGTRRGSGGGDERGQRGMRGGRADDGGGGANTGEETRRWGKRSAFVSL